ncbi:IQ domain-containing protein IQM6-like [Lycium ferocissimum]|uniref:IQ domain-containing protein IQM6-like n=1 Tax=Lycium ferocissimum TaxID=112874 RepID=UPI002815963E|nr:IQ domain-containing protein IQM6-like [Lycium ferocissimum]
MHYLYFCRINFFFLFSGNFNQCRTSHKFFDSEMGITYSCPFANFDDSDSKFESYLVRTLSFGSDGTRSTLPPINSNNDQNPQQSKMQKSHSSGKMMLEGTLSYKRRELEARIGLMSPAFDKEDKTMSRSDSLTSSEDISKKTHSMPDENTKLIPLVPEKQRDEAAVKLQKTYKSFRTRRRLADCAILVEQRWWKVLDSVELKHSSISFFDIQKPQTAFSRWSRALTRAAKVGKGLSKDEKACKLALQHWLEAIDPRHRYGHNLQFYYTKWLQADSKQPFFYWLDIGEGKEVNLEKCPRSKLHQQCIKYLGPVEREAYEVVIVGGKFIYKQSGRLLDTMGGPEEAKWIFVLSVSKDLYIGMKQKGTFQHSSFLAGGATLSAGRLVIEDGILKAVWPHSGHYLPTRENFEEFMTYLEQHNIDVTIIQKYPSDGEEGPFIRKDGGFGLRNSLSAPDFSQSNEESNTKCSDKKQTDSTTKYCKDAENSVPLSRRSQGLRPKIVVQIPLREDMFELFSKPEPLDTPVDGYETAEEYLSDTELSVSKQNLFDDETEEDYEETIPTEKIMKRINTHKRTKSFQLAHQLSCRWTTGAGPRIGCMRDYPTELQFRVIDEVYFSPRTTSLTPPKSARPHTPTIFSIEATEGRRRYGSESAVFFQSAPLVEEMRKYCDY